MWIFLCWKHKTQTSLRCRHYHHNNLVMHAKELVQRVLGPRPLRLSSHDCSCGRGRLPPDMVCWRWWWREYVSIAILMVWWWWWCVWRFTRSAPTGRLVQVTAGPRASTSSTLVPMATNWRAGAWATSSSTAPTTTVADGQPSTLWSDHLCPRDCQSGVARVGCWPVVGLRALSFYLRFIIIFLASVERCDGALPALVVRLSHKTDVQTCWYQIIHTHI